MAEKLLPFTQAQLENIAEQFGTPFHIYDEKALKKRLQNLYSAFEIFPNYKNFFAVKANPNPSLMKIMFQFGMGMDCSSLAELLLCEKCEITGENIMFTSNNTSDEEFQKAMELNAIINFDDISMIEHISRAVKNFPEYISFRINPGQSTHSNDIIGSPEEAKYGITMDQILLAYKTAQERGAKRFGVHTMVASNEIHADHFMEVTAFIVDVAIMLYEKLGISVEFINMGGGLGIPYRPEQEEIDIPKIAQEMQNLFQKIEGTGMKTPRLFSEHGRWIVGPVGYLVTKVHSHKNIYKKYVGVDACMADLMRPAMYGSYHYITVLGKESAEKEIVDVVGSLCENNDKFAINRELPKTERGDLLVLHDAGAHGHAMGFNYNGKLRHQELLWKENETVQKIRRNETYEDLFQTIIW